MIALITKPEKLMVAEVVERPKKPRGRPRKLLDILISSDDDTGRAAPTSSPTNSVSGVEDDLTISTANSSDSTGPPSLQSVDNDATGTKTRGRRKLYTTEEQYKESKRINSRNTYQKNAEKMKAARQVYKEAHREELKEKAREKYQKDKLERAEELKAKAKEKYEKKKGRGQDRAIDQADSRGESGREGEVENPDRLSKYSANWLHSKLNFSPIYILS
jgi:hypothetical protein